MSDELDVRVATLEVKMEHMERSYEENASTVKSMDGKMDALTSRLDKQNGAIPHMQQHLANISEELKAFNAASLEKQVKEAEDKGKLNTKVKVLWTVLGLLAASIVSLLTKILIGI